MTNRPLDYEHPFARLVPNDIVIPTTEVVKEEPLTTEHGPEMTATEVRERTKEAFERIMKDYKPPYVGVDLAITGTEVHKFVINHHGNLEITKVDIQAEEEPKTGWRFLGFDDEVYYGEGIFTIGEIYQIVEIDDHGSARFMDDRGTRMFEELKYFEEVK